jgi:hypothetical protein
VTLTQTLYARGEVTFLSLLQAQKILTETELAYVDAQAERWTGAVAIADLLQLEEFPPRADAPAAQPMGEQTTRPEEVKAPAAKKPDAGADKPNDKVQPAAPADAKPKAPLPPQAGRAAEPPAAESVMLVAATREISAAPAPALTANPATAERSPKRRGLSALIPEGFFPGRSAARR